MTVGFSCATFTDRPIDRGYPCGTENLSGGGGGGGRTSAERGGGEGLDP